MKPLDPRVEATWPELGAVMSQATTYVTTANHFTTTKIIQARENNTEKQRSRKNGGTLTGGSMCIVY